MTHTRARGPRPSPLAHFSPHSPLSPRCNLRPIPTCQRQGADQSRRLCVPVSVEATSQGPHVEELSLCYAHVSPQDAELRPKTPELCECCIRSLEETWTPAVRSYVSFLHRAVQERYIGPSGRCHSLVDIAAGQSAVKCVCPGNVRSLGSVIDVLRCVPRTLTH